MLFPLFLDLWQASSLHGIHFFSELAKAFRIHLPLAAAKLSPFHSLCDTMIF